MKMTEGEIYKVAFEILLNITKTNRGVFRKLF